MKNKDLIKLIEYYQEEIKQNDAMTYFTAEAIVNNFIDYCAENGYEINNCVTPVVSNLCKCSEKLINHIGPYYKECGKCGKQIL